jgi:AraC-like DNA-binding protein
LCVRRQWRAAAAGAASVESTAWGPDGNAQSCNRFQHAFKQHTGLSPYQYHLQLKIHRAEELLRGTDLSVKQIAQLLQFRSVYHFSTLFKRKTGRAPSLYRQQGPLGAARVVADNNLVKKPPKE